MEKIAVIVFSGGLDSTVALWKALNQGRKVALLSFSYGQRHSSAEVRARGRVIEKLEALGIQVVDGRSLTITRGLHEPLSEVSSLTNREIAVPKPDAVEGVPNTYVPGRNSLFLSAAFGYAQEIGATEVWTGFNALDYSGYPDCRPAYVAAMEQALNLGAGLEPGTIVIRTPLIRLTKREVVELGVTLGAPLGLTWSCYRGGEKPCGECDSCHYRAKGFAEAGIDDPALS